MKKILYTDYSSGFGGSSTVLYDFLKNLDRSKYEPIVVVTRDGQNFDKTRELGIDVIKAKITVIGMAPHRGLSTMGSLIFDLIVHLIPNVLKLRTIIKQRKIDLVHINNNIKHCIDIILAARLAGVPCVCHIRETRPVSKMDRIFGRFTQQVIVLNQTVYANMNKLLGSNRTQMIHDGIDLNVIINNEHAFNLQDELNPRHFYCIGFLGRLVKDKGVDILIMAAALVKKRHHKIRVLIIGSDPDQDHNHFKYLKNLVDDLDLNNEVLFTGWRSDKFELISIMDILVQSSSVPEGFGLTCIEAMALGKPVIATNVTGPSTIIEDNKTGLLIEPKRPDLMADAIIRLIEDPLLAREVAMAGRESVEQRFDIKGNTREIENIYQRFLVTENT